MGMTDMQFKAYLRALFGRLEEAVKSQDWELIKKLQLEIEKALED